MRLANKVAVVTGSGNGLGRMDAVMMAKEGAKLVVSDVNVDGGLETVKMIKEAGGEAIFQKCDTRISTEVSALMDKAVETYGRLDVMVANAGVARFGTITEVSEEDFDLTIAVNLKGVFLSIKYALPHMLRQGSGSIINMSSVSGLRGAPTLAAYNAAKGGVTLLTYNVASYYGEKGIRCNCLCPGMVDLTGMGAQMKEVRSNAAAAQGMAAPPPPRNTGVPTGRWGRPEEIANLIIFLASDESPWINGSAITIDGGSMASLSRIG